MTDRPNLLVIMSDDHAQWAGSPYGNAVVRTPTLEYLAQTGVKMANAFCPTPVCSPARASFFTGLYPSQHGVHDFIKSNADETGTRDYLVDYTRDGVTLPQLLSNAGYHTGLVGKWHLGRDDEPQPGFDRWFSVGRTFPYPSGTHTFFSGDAPVELKGYKTDILTDRAVDFLRTRDAAKPFFLFVGYTGTHSPWQNHPERLVSQYRGMSHIPDDTAYPFGRLAGETNANVRRDPGEARAQYYAAISHIDEGVGRLLDKLEAQGLRKNTLVVYTADHGLNMGQHGVWGKGNGTRPYNMLEETIRVPLIFNLGDELFAGQVRGEFTDHCDLFETLLEVADVTFERRRNYPGRSFKPLLHEARPPEAWKTLQFGEYGTLRMARSRRFKLVRRYPDGPCELFDLVNNPGETVSLFHDPAFRAVVAELTAAIDTFFEHHSDPAKNGLNVRNLPPCNPGEVWRGNP